MIENFMYDVFIASLKKFPELFGDGKDSHICLYSDEYLLKLPEYYLDACSDYINLN